LIVADLSSNNHPNDAPIDWSAVVGVDAFIIKATQGSSYVNPWYASDLAGALSIHRPALAYHYAGFGDIATELDWFIAHAGPLAACLDFETSQDAPWIATFLNGIPRLSTQKLAYGSESTFPRNLPALSWIAAYGQPNSPPGAILWQYTSTATVPGITGNVDLSTWLGTLDQWSALFAPKMEDLMGTPAVVIGNQAHVYGTSSGHLWEFVSPDPSITPAGPWHTYDITQDCLNAGQTVPNLDA